MEEKKIYKAIAGVMEAIGVVSKEKEYKSNQGSYKFRGIDDVMNALHPAMVKNKIFVVPVILEQIRETRTSRSGTAMYVSICKIRYEFYAEDGSCVSAIVIGEGMDTGDKATNKAMSIAFKYACFQVFCIPTEEMIDPDAERPEFDAPETKATGKKKSSSNKGKAAVSNASKPASQNANIGTDAAQSMKISEQMANTINTLVAKYSHKGLKLEKILSMYKITSLSDMTVADFKNCMEKLKLYDDGGNGN